MPVATPDTDNDSRKSSLSPLDRSRPNQPERERRQTLGAVGRVASRVRTSGINRLQAAFASQKTRDGADVGEDVDSSPWGVGKAAVVDTSNRLSKPYGSQINLATAAVPGTPGVETESLSPDSSATSVQTPARSQTSTSRHATPNTNPVASPISPSSPNLLTPPAPTQTTLNDNRVVHDRTIDASSPLSVDGSAATSSANSGASAVRDLSVVGRRGIDDDRARPNTRQNGQGLGGTPVGFSNRSPSQTGNISAFSTMVNVSRGRTVSNLETEAAKRRGAASSISASSGGQSGAMNDMTKRTSKVAFRASVDVSHGIPKNEKSEDVAATVDNADGPQAVQEKSLLRSLLNRGRSVRDGTNLGGKMRSPGDRDRKRNVNGANGRASLGVLSGPGGSSGVLTKANSDAGERPPGASGGAGTNNMSRHSRSVSRAMDLKKGRSRRGKDREDGGGSSGKRGISGWFSSMINGVASEFSSEAKAGGRSRHTPRGAGRRDSAGPSSPMQVLRRNSSPQGGKNGDGGKSKDLSKLDFADDEFYDSEDDEEGTQDNEAVVPSLARDDFVAYQTSAKRKNTKARASMMRT